MGQVPEKVRRGLELHRHAPGAPPHARKQQPGRLDSAPRPPVLLEIDLPHPGRQLSRHFDVWKENEAPPGQLGTIAEVQVLGKRCGPPAASALHAPAPPHAGRPVEVEEQAGAEARLVLDAEVGVEEKSLRPGEPALSRVQVPPGRLHHSDPRVRERPEQLPNEAGPGKKVGVEEEKEIAARPARAPGQRTRLVAGPIGSAKVLDGAAAPPPEVDAARRDHACLVRRVVEQLDLQQGLRIVEPAGRVDEPLDHIGLVVHGQLDGHPRKRPDPLPGDRTGRQPQEAPQEQSPVDTKRHQ